MFKGSGHVKYGEFDTLLEAVGGTNNGSTEADRTNYYIDVPSNALDLALFLESDRMGWLLDAMSPDTVNAQREVVKNERRQSYENAPYGMASDRDRQDALPGGSSVPVAHDRLHGGSHRGLVRRRRGVLQEVLPAVERDAGRWRAISTSRGACGCREVVRRRQTGDRPRAADRLSAPAAHERATQDDPGSRAAPSLVYRLDHAVALRAGRRRARRRVAPARRRQELAALQAARLRPADRTGRHRVAGISRRSVHSSRSSSRLAHPRTVRA